MIENFKYFIALFLSMKYIRAIMSNETPFRPCPNCHAWAFCSLANHKATFAPCLKLTHPMVRAEQNKRDDDLDVRTARQIGDGDVLKKENEDELVENNGRESGAV